MEPAKRPSDSTDRRHLPKCQPPTPHQADCSHSTRAAHKIPVEGLLEACVQVLRKRKAGTVVPTAMSAIATGRQTEALLGIREPPREFEPETCALRVLTDDCRVSHYAPLCTQRQSPRAHSDSPGFRSIQGMPLEGLLEGGLPIHRHLLLPLQGGLKPEISSDRNV